jgi:voltage-gated potassium channel Kch
LQAYAVTSFLFVLASIAGFCVETLPIMFHLENVTRKCGPGQFNETIVTLVSTPFLAYLDYICTAFFTVELIVRVLFAPNKLAFFRSFMNIIDIVALMPLYVQIVLDLTDQYYCLKNDRAVLETIFVLRIIRIFRVFHLVKHYKALKILVHAIKASIQELLMLSIFLFIATLVFSTLIFYAERPADYSNMASSQFGTIPIGFWWSIITMTTVGYGDVHPTTAMGYAIGAICALAGVLLIALTIPVISNNFALFYLHARTRADITKDKASESHAARRKSKCAVPSNSSVRRTGAKGLIDSRALLSNDSNSTTDESGIMLNLRNPADATPSRDVRQQEVVRVPIANIDETVM